jgi:hypothetical protein
LPSNFPDSYDSFNEPSIPEETTLSSAGTGTRNHTQHHRDLGDAIEAMQPSMALQHHDHSGTDALNPTDQLDEANTHQNTDTDSGAAARHHTLGTGATQAAAGNHSHDYNGPFIFNKPLIRCTTTTRPGDPDLGLMIWETDTNTMRVWSAFPGNTIVPGYNYTDAFSRVSSTDLGANYAQAYVIGSSPANGIMATPVSGAMGWIDGSNTKCRCIARNIDLSGAVTLSDDQSLTFTTGPVAMEIPTFSRESPTNDVYLRMSADSQSYIRLSIDSNSAQFYYTTTGFANEKQLGSAPAGTWSQGIAWEVKVVGQEFYLYRGGVQILKAVDFQNVSAKGANNRGWGLGMTATVGQSSQLSPGSIDNVVIKDLPMYTSTPIWQLLPVGAIPYVRAETHVGQQIAITNPIAAFFDAVWEDIFAFFRHGSIGTLTNIPPTTDIVITEPGHYDVHASIPWDPAFPGMDRGMVGFTVNSVDIGRKNLEFIRGNQYSPGFPQTNEIFMHWHFAAGDILNVVAQHNSRTPAWLFASTATGNKQVADVDLKFTGP